MAEKFAEHHGGIVELMATKTDVMTIQQVVQGIVATNIKVEGEIRDMEYGEEMMALVRKNAEDAQKMGSQTSIEVGKTNTKCDLMQKMVEGVKDDIERKNGEDDKFDEAANLEMAIKR